MTAGEIVGDKEIKRGLKSLASSSATRRVIRSGQSKALTILLRGMRNAIPPKYKSAKKALGRKQKKDTAKAGLGVGKRTTSKKQRDPKKPGVGISKANIHWLIFGTPPREGRGSMPNIGEAGKWIQNGVAASEKQATNEMKQQMRKKIDEEYRKAAR